MKGQAVNNFLHAIKVIVPHWHINNL